MMVMKWSITTKNTVFILLSGGGELRLNLFLITRRQNAIKKHATLDITSDTLVSIVSYRSVDSTEIAPPRSIVH